MHRTTLTLVWAALIILVIMEGLGMAQSPTGDVIHEVKTKDGKRLCLYNNGTWGPAIHSRDEGWQCPPPMTLPNMPRRSPSCDNWLLYPEKGIICFWPEANFDDLMCLPFNLEFYQERQKGSKLKWKIR